MLDDRRRRLGRFGIRQAAASSVAIAILAVSPAVAPVANSHLGDTGFAVAKAVFGEPVSAQEIDPCDADPCIAVAKRVREECYEYSPWYTDPICWLNWLLDVVDCSTST